VGVKEVSVLEKRDMRLFDEAQARPANDEAPRRRRCMILPRLDPSAPVLGIPAPWNELR
jgi:hypothetical protein